EPADGKVAIARVGAGRVGSTGHPDLVVSAEGRIGRERERLRPVPSRAYRDTGCKRCKGGSTPQYLDLYRVTWSAGIFPPEGLRGAGLPDLPTIGRYHHERRLDRKGSFARVGDEGAAGAGYPDLVIGPEGGIVGEGKRIGSGSCRPSGNGRNGGKEGCSPEHLDFHRHS